MMREHAEPVLVLCISAEKACAGSALMMARVRPGGLFEMLSADAWARSLGYTPEELSGKPLRELIEKAAPGWESGALLDGDDTRPLDVTLRCRDGQGKRFRFHRRFDAYQDTMYVLVDELAESIGAPLRK